MSEAKTKLLGKVGREALYPGEEPRAVVRAMKPGNIKRSAVAGGIGGIVGAVLAERMDKTSPASGVIEIPRMVLALTDRRLLVFKQSAMTAKAKELVVEFPVDDIVGVEVADGKVLGMKIVPLGVQFADGTGFAVEVPFIDRKEGERFADAAQEMIDARG